MDPRVDDRTRRAWDRIWERSDHEQEIATGRSARARATRARYTPWIPPAGWVVEAGCGVGTEIAALEDQPGLAGRLVGVDRSLPALARLRQHDRVTPAIGADVHALPFADGSVCAYLSFGVLEHFPWGPWPALREAWRVLAPGGMVLVTVPAPNLVWRLVRWKRRRLQSGSPSGYYETAFRLTEIRDAVRRTGFTVVEAVPIDHGFTLWGCGGPFRGPGHYETSHLAEVLGRVAARLAPRAMAFATMVTAIKPEDPEDPGNEVP